MCRASVGRYEGDRVGCWPPAVGLQRLIFWTALLFLLLSVGAQAPAEPSLLSLRMLCVQHITPYSARKYRDVFCLVMYILFWIGLLAVAVLSVALGEEPFSR